MRNNRGTSCSDYLVVKLKSEVPKLKVKDNVLGLDIVERQV